MTSSVRRRLTSWYAISTLALLVASLLSMRGFARQALEREHDAAVERSAELVRSFFRAELAEYRQIEPTIAHLASELVFAGMGIDFLRPSGERFAAARAPAGSATPPPPLRERVVALEGALAPGWQLRLRISVSDLEAARQRIDRLTLFAVPVAVLMAAVVAWLMTGRALAPVRTMAMAADRLGGGTPGRLPISDPHDEFGRLGRAFNGLLDRLDRALALQRRFLADAAHELRTPLARMLGESGAQLAQAPSSDDRQALERIDRELRHAARIIDELLLLARSDADTAPPVLTPQFLDDIVSDAVARFQSAATAKRLALALDAPAAVSVAGHELLLQRMVGVLVDNAIRYTPEGGEVRVSARRSGDEVVLTVDDSGIGIASAEREAVFERFWRGQAARQLAPEGTGLGLAIAAGIASQHGAAIRITESPLGGTRTEVRFPGSPV